MSLPEASALARRSGQRAKQRSKIRALHLERYDPAADRRALEELAQWCQRFSPTVCLEESDSPESLLLTVTGCGHLFGGEERLAEQIWRELSQRGFCQRPEFGSTAGQASSGTRRQDTGASLRSGPGHPKQSTGRASGTPGIGGDRAPDWVTRLALAHTPGAAWALAHYAPLGRPASQSSQSTEEDVSPGWLVVPADEAASALQDLPVAALRLPLDTLDLLQELGLERIGQLQSVSRDLLASHLGTQVVERIDQATGGRIEMTTPHHAPAPLEAAWSFEQPAERHETIQAAVKYLIGQVSVALAERLRVARELTCRFVCEPAEETGEDGRSTKLDGDGMVTDSATYRGTLRCPGHPDPVGIVTNSATGLGRDGMVTDSATYRGTLRCPGHPDPVGIVTNSATSRRVVRKIVLRLFCPTASPRHWEELLLLELERQGLPGPVLSITLEATALAPWTCRQRELFADDRPRESPRALARLIDRFVCRLGSEQVCRAQLVADAQPEQACRFEPLAVAAPAGSASAGVTSAGRRPRRKERKGRTRTQPAVGGSRPLKLCRPPWQAAVLSVVPDGPPIRLHWKGCEHAIVQAWGPERIETGWWRRQPIQRDYYQIETAAGLRAWLFRRLRDGRWFVHGWFD